MARSALLKSSAFVCLLQILNVTMVSAQTPNLQARAANAVSDDVIIVTAQRREQRLQDVPLAVSAVTGRALETQGVNNPTELRYFVPSLNFVSSANVNGEGFQLRGVGTAIFGDTVEQSVGVVVDGVPLTRGSMFTADMLDVERVEVLRGPQGMLFGKNASAGLISIVTRNPKLEETSLALRASYATRNETKLAATGNIALGPNAALRISAATTTRDGFVTNIRRNEVLNNRDEQSVRVRLLAEPLPELRFILTGDWNTRKSLCCAWTARAAPAGTAFAALNAAAGIVPSPTNLKNAAGAAFFQNLDTGGLSVEMQYDLKWADLVALSAWKTWEQSNNNDPDLLPINVLDVNSGIGEVNQATNEIRLSSKPGAFEWTAGLFWSDVTNNAGGIQAGTLGLNLPPPGTLGTDVFSMVKQESQAVFAQVSYRVFDRFKLIAGARYTDEDLRLNFRQRAATGTLAGIPGRFVGAFTTGTGETNLSWRVIAQVDLTDEAMIYASAARGYKGPAIDTLGINSPSALIIKPEIPTSYEAGLRATLFDRTTTLNIALFNTEFKDFQAEVFDQNVFPSRFRTTNAGQLSTQGAEVELSVKPMQGLSLRANLAYVDAVFDDFKGISCYPGQAQLPASTVRTSDRQCIQLVAGGPFLTNGTGNPLQNAPKLTYALGAGYERPIGNLTLTADVNYFWRDEVFFTSSGDPNARQEAYGLLGASIGIGAADDRWRVSLFGKNLTDQNFVNRVISNPVLGAPGVYSQFVSPDAERIIGITLNIAFGDR